MKKKIKAGFAAAAIIVCLLLLVSQIKYYMVLRSENLRGSFEADNVSLLTVYEEPFMSFGSGHKYLYLFSRHHVLLGKCKFGEFAFTIKDVDENEKVITLLVQNKYFGQDADYINSWLEKNKKIGKYKIQYAFETI